MVFTKIFPTNYVKAAFVLISLAKTVCESFSYIMSEPNKLQEFLPQKFVVYIMTNLSN